MATARINTSPPVIDRVLTDVNELRGLAPAWEELLADSATNCPFVAPPWMLTWWDVYGSTQKRTLRVLRFDQGEQLIGLAPLVMRRHWYAPGLPFRRLELLGSGEREEEAVCSDYLNIIARRGRETVVARQFIQALRTQGGWDELVIPLMDGTGLMPELLALEATKVGWGVTREQTTEALHIPLPATWEQYLKSLDHKNRYKVKRALRDLEEWSGGDWCLHRATTPEEVDEGRRILIDLHQQRWAGTGLGTFRAERFVAFHQQAMLRFLERNALGLYWLSVRSQPVAALYALEWNRVSYFYQCGRTLDVPRSLRVGRMLLALVIRSAIEAGLTEFDFLGGVAEYKKELALASRPLLQLRIARRTLVERLRCCAEWGRPAARWMKNRLWRKPGQNSGDGGMQTPEL